jgi:hypothetical protein
MSLSIYRKGDYEEFHALKAATNKANFMLKTTQKGVAGRKKILDEWRKYR